MVVKKDVEMILKKEEREKMKERIIYEGKLKEKIEEGKEVGRMKFELKGRVLKKVKVFEEK